MVRTGRGRAVATRARVRQASGTGETQVTPAVGATLGGVSRRFLSPRWLALHAVALAAVVVFCRLGWWQIRRAGEGNPLSYGYALEWPVFAAFTIFVWYRIVRDSVEPPAEPPRRATPLPLPTLPERPAAPAVTDQDDPVLAAYNRYLRELNRRDG